MALLRFLSLLLTFLLVAVVAAAWLVVPRLDPNLFRADLTAVASARLGRGVRIDGPMHLDLLPEPTLTADAVRLGADQGLTISAKELRLRVALGALLAGRIDARELVLRGASLHVPWPLDPAGMMVRTPRWLSAVTARVEDGKLDIGGLNFSGIDATLSTTADSGSYVAAGTAILSGQPWRFTARLTQPGLDGSAGLDVTLDGQGPAMGIGGTLSGQIGPDGTLAGRIAGRGPDLSHLLPAPAVAFKAEGRLTIAGGLAAADDLAMEIGGSPARGAVALRVTPTPRLDLALAASRLDLDAWIPVLLRSATLRLPTGIDLSAEAATFAGGTLRGLRAAVDLSAEGAEVREARAVLPGDAPLRLSGRIVPGDADQHPARFEGDVSVTAPALRTTLGWVQQAGVAPIASLPEGVLRTADLSGHVVAEPGQVAVTALAGSIDGGAVAGSLSLRGGKRWVLGAGLNLDRLDLESWLPGDVPSLASLPVRFAPFDVNLRLEAKQALLRGIALAPLSLDAGAEGGRLVVRKLDAQAGGVHASASATIGEGGRVSEGRLDIEAPRAAALAALLPDDLAFLGHEAPGLWQTATDVQVLGEGAPDKLALKISADLADLRLESQPVLDLTRHGWTAVATLRHPGAPRLLRAFGVSGAESWLGAGSLGLIAHLSGAPGKVSADSFDLTAGGLRASGALLLDRAGAVPLLSGHVVAETLPLPLPDPGAAEPLPVGPLRLFDASVKLRAETVLAGSRPVLTGADGVFSLRDRVARLDLIHADLNGGALAGVATLDTRAEPSALALAFGITGAAIAGPVFGLPIDLTDGTLEAHVGVTATGYAPAALLATLTGDATLAVRNGAVAGIALRKAVPPAEGATPDEAAPRAALEGGVTLFDSISLTADVERGAVALHSMALTGPDGGMTGEGTIDLPGRTLDLRLALRPPVADPPTIGLRLTGPWTAMRRSLDLTDLVRWREAHAPPPPTDAPATQTP